MARKFKIVTKDITHDRLTVAKDRVSLKFTIYTTLAERVRMEAAARLIDAALPDVQYTLRGTFNTKRGQITLTDHQHLFTKIWQY